VALPTSPGFRGGYDRSCGSRPARWYSDAGQSAAPATPSHLRRRAAAKEAPMSEPRLLVVDDEIDLLLPIRRFFENRG
jgi:hypothetical protein